MNNIKVLHRVFLEDDDIKCLYNSRIKGLAYQYSDLIEYMDESLDKGYQFGSLEQAFNDSSIIHLTFDDGYKEHLTVAKKIKERYCLPKEHLTFCINENNCTQATKICTDVFYYLLQNDEIAFIQEQMQTVNYRKVITNENFLEQFTEIKNKVFNNKNQQTFNLFQKLCDYCKLIGLELPFLNTEEVVELSRHFSIASHAIHHYNLTSLEELDAMNEINDSKIALEKMTNTKIDIFCYPDGKYDEKLQNFCREAGYLYALAIKNERANQLDRLCISRNLHLS